MQKLNVILLNDTTRAYKHLGCQRVVEHIRRCCNHAHLNIIASFQDTQAYKDPEYIRWLKKCDGVIVNGEGTLHSDQQEAVHLMRAAEIARKQFNKKVYLINSLWENNTALNHYLECFSLIFTRDSASAKAIIQQGFKAYPVCDMSFYPSLPSPNQHIKRKKGMVIDSVKADVSYALYHYSVRKRLPFKIMGIEENFRVNQARLLLLRWFLYKKNIAHLVSLDDINAARFIITGRFHAVCFAIQTRTPFIAISSNTHKIEHLLEDCGVNKKEDFLCTPHKIRKPNMNIASNDWQKLIAYAQQAKAKIDKMFGEIRQDMVSLALEEVQCQ